ncbi:hypothetical protein HanIR_Chr16g0840581 [Helianthus annuus]|nr:hypothetical protein HanIR_Chr16g0840581 [Helianthus annuus]
MSNSTLLFFFLFLFFISFTTSSINTTHKCSVQQTLALLLFKQNLSSINDTLFEYDSEYEDWLGSGYNPLMMNWNTSTNRGVQKKSVSETESEISENLYPKYLQFWISENSEIRKSNNPNFLIRIRILISKISDNPIIRYPKTNIFINLYSI